MPAACKIYTAPPELAVPQFNPRDIHAYHKATEDYVERVKRWARTRASRTPDHSGTVGEEIRFHVADGYARYIVLSLRPPALIHLALGDAYRFEYAHLLNAATIKSQVAREKALTALFAGKADTL